MEVNSGDSEFLMEVQSYFGKSVFIRLRKSGVDEFEME